MNTITTKSLPFAVIPTSLSWCPCMDLIAVGSVSGGVSLYRLSGQKVWNIAGKRKLKVVKTVWRDDGKVLAVVYEDSSYQLVKSSNGKVISSEEGRSAKVLKWIEQDDPDLVKSTFKLNNGDVIDNLPKLSGLSTKPGLIIDTKSDNSISTPGKGLSFVVTGNKQLDISLYGIFTIEGIHIGREDAGRDCEVLFVNSNPLDASKGIVIISASNTIYYETFDFQFITKFGNNYLSEVSIIPAQINSLIEYLKESTASLRKEVDLIIETNNKFLDITSDTSTETIKVELFDFLITGSMNENINKWILSRNEMGYKKWNKATISSYENCRKLLFENLVNGVERVIILLSRLRGLANWKERGVPLGLSSDDLDQALKYSNRFFESINKCLWEFNDEFDKFKSFALWLELGFESVLDRVVGFSRVDEPAVIKAVHIMKYITDYLPGSILIKWLDDDESSNITIHLYKLENVFLKSMTNTKKSMKSLVYFSNNCIRLAPNGFTVLQRYVGETNYLVIYKQMDNAPLLIVKIDQTIQIAKCDAGTLGQVDFIDDETIIYLSINSDSRLLQISNYKDLNYTEIDLHNKILVEVSDNLPTIALKPTLNRTFDDDFIPSSFSINGIKDRRVGCILNSDYQRYIFFDLDKGREGVSK